MIRVKASTGSVPNKIFKFFEHNRKSVTYREWDKTRLDCGYIKFAYLINKRKNSDDIWPEFLVYILHRSILVKCVLGPVLLVLAIDGVRLNENNIEPQLSDNNFNGVKN